MGQIDLDAGRLEGSLRNFRTAHQIDPSPAWLEPKIKEIAAMIGEQGKATR
jgi:hypothetical protein